MPNQQNEIRAALEHAPVPPGMIVTVESIQPLPGGGYRVVLQVR
jgi:hypothetical protein